MAFQDLYEVTVTQTFRGQIISNVFTLYQELAFVPIGGTEAAVLAQNFAFQLLPLISGWQPVDIVTTSVRARNLFDPADDFDLAVAVPGAAPDTTDILPTFNAIGFSLNGDNALVKNGSKRFAGLTEIVLTDGVITNGTLLIQLTDLAEAMENYITVGVLIPDNVFRFCVVKRIREGTPGNYTYRMPETTAEGVFSLIVSVAFNVLVTSQISRKVGVGQ